MPGPLEGIKILELIRVAPGAFCTMMLADMGAEVLKIETPPTDTSEIPTAQAADEARRAAFQFVNRNKQSIAINLKHAVGQKILHRLAADADVLVEGFRPGVMARLGGDYATLSQINPRLVYCSLSGFGQDGPYRALPAHDLNYLAISGVLDRKSTRLNSSHVAISYAVFCLKKKNEFKVESWMKQVVQWGYVK